MSAKLVLLRVKETNLWTLVVRSGTAQKRGGFHCRQKKTLSRSEAPQTGNGHREASVAALDFYSEWKSVYVDYSDTLQRAQIDT